ncbi:putative ABC transport system permease protein [Salinimicrobium catena]|uniref:Putative ABC transport system permease protein n=1 Tax=Salinimicrobium catena TaxID=390640 RepID=A0A1H5JZ51_9FLAO|nr:ABC transporter permease [Salinimicrobium catena]SDK92167.1 putative ABC transport system permease protein [Salinimicrobium catena]SEE57823.1 putative ABC transport system permease protein [Salinimicrobium catena]
MLIYLRVLKESFNFAINALKNNKLRTMLSLLGVTIGIFSIIAVLAAVDSLEKEIKGSLSSLDQSTMIVTRFSFGPTEVPQWKRQQFPDVTYEEYEDISRNLPDLEAASFVLNVPNEPIKYQENTANDVGIAAVSYEYYDIEALQLEEGRFFNQAESVRGAPVIILGHDVAESLFPGGDPMGKRVRLYGRKFTVIGLLEKMGQGLFGGGHDSNVFVPVNAVRRIYGSNSRGTFPQIVIKPEDGVDNAEFVALLEQQIRNNRGLRREEINNFFVNQLKGFTDFIDNITGQMNFIGLIISGFSLLVGGFGIANIMFVSVKERTNLIGIQKSLGAKNRFILFQFLFEAVILAVIGGLIGLFLVWVISLLASQFTGDFEFVLSPWNLFIGTAVSAVIGLISGIVPAISASKLDPVEAIRTGM